MASSLSFESLGQALLTVLVIMLFQVFLDHQRASGPSKHTDENFANVFPAISCLSSKYDQKQLHEKQYLRYEASSRTYKPTSTPSRVLFGHDHPRTSSSSNYTRKCFGRFASWRARSRKQLLCSLFCLPLHQLLLLLSCQPLLQSLLRGQNSVPPEPPTSAPDQSGILTISDSGEEEDDDDMFAPGGDYNASAPWE